MSTPYAEPLAIRNADGTISLDWGGLTDSPALCTYELIRGMVDQHNDMTNMLSDICTAARDYLEWGDHGSRRRLMEALAKRDALEQK